MIFQRTISKNNTGFPSETSVLFASMKYIRVDPKYKYMVINCSFPRILFRKWNTVQIVRKHDTTRNIRFTQNYENYNESLIILFTLYKNYHKRRARARKRIDWLCDNFCFELTKNTDQSESRSVSMCCHWCASAVY